MRADAEWGEERNQRWLENLSTWSQKPFHSETVLRKLESWGSLTEVRMTADRISELVAAGESETLEFKTTTGQRSDAAKAVCAMLNQRGGYVLFGVTPEGTVVGQQVGEHTIEKMSAEIQRIEPRIFPSIERVPVAGGKEVIVVIARPGSAKPYAYKQTAYRRVGNTTLAMSAEEYNSVLFERMHSERRWENQPATGWTVNDLEAAEIQKTVRAWSKSSRLIRSCSPRRASLVVQRCWRSSSSGSPAGYGSGIEGRHGN